MREIWRIMFGVAGGIVGVGVCYVELAFDEQNFNEEIKLGEMEERSEQE